MCILLKKKFRPREVQCYRRSHSLVSTRTRIQGEAICHRLYEITPVCGGTLAGLGDNEREDRVGQGWEPGGNGVDWEAPITRCFKLEAKFKEQR